MYGCTGRRIRVLINDDTLEPKSEDIDDVSGIFRSEEEQMMTEKDNWFRPFVPLDFQALAQEVFAYRPNHRDVAYLADLLQPLVNGSLAANRVIPAIPEARTDEPGSPTWVAGLLDKVGADALLFQGDQLDIERLKKVLPQVDTPQSQVMVPSLFYKANTGHTEGNTFELLMSVPGGKLSGGLFW
ncbi:hypothetical protein [Chromobacterium sphagni]|nr:hypothetical protein [Chromobacterium sphagni]